MFANYFKVYVTLFTLFQFSFCFSLNIVQIQNQTDIQNYLKPGTWIFTDLDRTLVARNSGTPHAFELNPAYTQLLKSLQDQGYPVFGLTARGPKQHTYTQKQLKHLGLDFKKSLALVNAHDLKPSQFPTKNASFIDGILYSPSCTFNKKKCVRTKGINLEAFLDLFPAADRSILMIDDQKMQLEAIAKGVKAKGTLAYFPFQGHVLFKKDTIPTDFPVSFEGLKALEVITVWDRQMVRLEDTTTKKTYLLQSHPNNDVMKEEILALRLYETLGVSVPHYIILNGRGIEMNLKGFKASGANFFILFEDIHKTAVPLNEEQQKDHLKAHFVRDAFLSHSGLMRNARLNQVCVHHDGSILRPDMFATLRSDLTGKHKKKRPDWSLEKVIELDWFRDTTRNPHFAPLLNELATEDLKRQIQEILDRETPILDTFETTQILLVMNKTEELRAMLKSRLNDLRERLTKL